MGVPRSLTQSTTTSTSTAPSSSTTLITTTTTLPPTTSTTKSTTSDLSSTTISSSTSSYTLPLTTTSMSTIAAETTTASWSSPFVPSDNMDFEWLLKEFLLQCAVNLFCILIILLAIWIYIEFWMKPVQRPQTPAPPKASKYEEELEKIKLGLATISTTYLLTKNMRSKWRSEAPEVEEEEVEGQENGEEETDTVEEELKEENDEPDVNNQGKEE